MLACADNFHSRPRNNFIYRFSTSIKYLFYRSKSKSSFNHIANRYIFYFFPSHTSFYSLILLNTLMGRYSIRKLYRNLNEFSDGLFLHFSILGDILFRFPLYRRDGICNSTIELNPNVIHSHIDDSPAHTVRKRRSDIARKHYTGSDLQTD